MLFDNAGFLLPSCPCAVAASHGMSEPARVGRNRIRIKCPVRNIDRSEVFEELAAPELLGRPEGKLVPSVESLFDRSFGDLERDYRVGREAAVGFFRGENDCRSAERAHARHLIHVAEKLGAAALAVQQFPGRAPLGTRRSDGRIKVHPSDDDALFGPVKPFDLPAEITRQRIAGNIVPERSAAVCTLHDPIPLSIPCQSCPRLSPGLITGNILALMIKAHHVHVSCHDFCRFRDTFCQSRPALSFRVTISGIFVTLFSKSNSYCHFVSLYRLIS